MRSRRHGLTATLFVASAALVISGCAASPSGDSGSSSQGATGSSGMSGGAIPIGVDIEMSGAAAVQGAAYSDAVKLVAKQINDSGGVLGRKINLIIRDNQSDPTQSLQVAKSMISNDNVVAIIGGGSSPTTLSMADTVETSKIPTISMGSSGAIIQPPAKRKYLFKTPAGADLIAQVMIKDFAKRGVRSVGFLAVDNPYGQAGLAAFQAAAKAGDVSLVDVEKFEGSDKDYTVQVTKLAAKKPDAIVVWAIPPGAGIAAKSIKASGFSGKVYFDAGAADELFLKGAGSAANGDYVVAAPVLIAKDAPADLPNLKQLQSFYTAYNKAYGDYSGFASYAADALHLIIEAIKKAGSTDSTKIRDALDTLKYVGIGGVFTMKPTDHLGLTADSLTLVTVKDDAWSPVT